MLCQLRYIKHAGRAGPAVQVPSAVVDQAQMTAAWIGIGKDLKIADEVKVPLSPECNNGVSISRDKLSAVKDWPLPTDKTQLMSFLGFVNYHRDHIQLFAELTSSLYGLVARKGQVHLDGRTHVCV